MRIAFIVNQFPVLSETFILNQITGLIDRGHHVDIYADRPTNLSKTHPDVESYNLLNRTYYFPALPKNWIVRIFDALKLILAHSHLNPQLTFNAFNISKYGKDAINFKLLYYVIPFLNHNTTYDIIQCHFGPIGLKAVVLKELDALSGLLITTFHGFDVFQFPYLSGKNVYDHLFAVGNIFFTVSQRMKEQLIELGCDVDKVFVHKVGVDLNKFKFLPPQPHAKHPVQIVTLARLVEKKGLEYSIRAIGKLISSKPHLKQNLIYIIIGDGPLREELKRLIEHLGVNRVVYLSGWMNQTEVVEVLKSADVFLAPSVTGINGDQEGIPTVLMEAMAMGKPVISTYHSGIPELVQDCISGFLVPEKDVEALADKLNNLIEHPDLWAEMGHAGRAFVEATHDINKLNDQLVQFYKEQLSQ